ncbi:hypothetical protein OG785_45510 [Streptomyces sp. NBC_00006]|uniref:hypothetical protein n=1 Tax=Streptomyces sp. NBC_00006 TaxID=2975619 RepID=UPI00224E855E|nr:hypothetical protein [Streptomyces sp. NBC_00006]MCX5537818.1 hypothetical protein [Streptomyces sp. NBC_00006]
MDTAELIRRAERGMRGKDPEHGFPIDSGHAEAIPYLLLALVREQQAIGAQLAGLDATLGRIAAALEQDNAQPELAPVTEPKRRWWQPARRKI